MRRAAALLVVLAAAATAGVAGLGTDGGTTGHQLRAPARPVVVRHGLGVVPAPRHLTDPGTPTGGPP